MTFTNAQVSTENQIEKNRVYVEQGISGKIPALQREQFSKLHQRMGSGDSLVFTKLIDWVVTCWTLWLTSAT